MEEIKDGGPAFPRPCGQYAGTSTIYHNDSQKGMNLRDWFAGQALAGSGTILNFEDSAPNKEYWIELTTKNAYRYADAMLKAREAR